MHARSRTVSTAIHFRRTIRDAFAVAEPDRISVS
jgi:hypothetical protein